MQEQGRFNYVTPTSYLELLSIFSAIFGLKKNELLQQKKRTKTGLDKLLSTEREVTKLRAELEEMQPLLAEAVEETTQTMETIAVDSKVGFLKSSCWRRAYDQSSGYFECQVLGAGNLKFLSIHNEFYE